MPEQARLAAWTCKDPQSRSSPRTLWLQHERNVNASRVRKALVHLPLLAAILANLKPKPVLPFVGLGGFVQHCYGDTVSVADYCSTYFSHNRS